jgi:hypothetical protein
MSAICVVPVVIAGGAAWPVVCAAAMATASVMGFKAVGFLSSAEITAEVELSAEGSEAVTQDIGRGESLTFAKDDVQLEFCRNTRGRITVKVHGKNRTIQELKSIGRQTADTLVQQYAYHRLMTELKQRNFNVVDQQVETDGTVRLQVRVYQG